MINSNLINYLLYYENYIIKIFTNNGNYNNINRFYIYINPKLIIIIRLNQTNEINFEESNNLISCYIINNIENIELQYTDDDKNKNIIHIGSHALDFLIYI